MAVNAYLSPWLRAGFLDNNGNPLANGQLYAYQGGTSVPAATYTDSTATTPNTNPITLNSRGEAPFGVWLSPGTAYKFVLTDASGNQIWTVDQVYSIPQYQTGSFTATGGGFSGTVSFPVNYTVNGNVATIAITPATGTSASNFFQLTGIPSILRPQTLLQSPFIPFSINNGAFIFSGVTIQIIPGASTWDLLINGAHSWTSSGTKGLYSGAPPVFSYLLV